jgi:ABC-type hemin transport system ATPase subunit
METQRKRERDKEIGSQREKNKEAGGERDRLILSRALMEKLHSERKRE